MGFEPTPPEGLVLKTIALDRSATLPYSHFQLIYNFRTNAGLHDESIINYILLKCRLSSECCRFFLRYVNYGRILAR